MGARQHPAETFGSRSPSSGRGLGCAWGATAGPGGETAPGTAEAVGLESTKMYFWRAQLQEVEEVTGGRKWCPLSGPGLLPRAELGAVIVLQLLHTRNHTRR